MAPDSADFEHEYDLSALERLQPLGQTFQMLVTPRYRDHYLRSQYEAFTAGLVRAMSETHGLFVDVGAHYGFFSLLAASRNRDIDIVACEPIPETREVLRRNLAFNGIEHAQIVEKAVSDRTGIGRFNVSLSSDNCSFYPHPAAPPIGKLEVGTVTVDELLAEHEVCPTLCKVDTDGHEIQVLEGMEKTFERFENLKLFVELNPKMQRLAGHQPEDLVEALFARGFDVYLVEDHEGRAFRLRHAEDWVRHMREPESYCNLYCCRREVSLSTCFFSHSPGLGGAERSLLELVSELISDWGSICTVVVPEEGSLQRRLEEAGAATLIAPLPWWCDPPGGGSESEHAETTDFTQRLVPGASLLLGDPLELLRQIDPDVLVTHTIAIPWGALLAPILAKPHVWHICEFGDLDHRLRFDLPFRQVAEIVRASSARVFTAVEAIGHHLFGTVDEGYCRTLYRHVRPPAPSQTEVPTGLFRREGALRLGVFASKSRAKGQDVAIRATARLRDAGRDVELLLAGPARKGFDEELEQLIEENSLQEFVHLEGFIEHVDQVMRETDVVLIGSRMEAFGRVAVEAMLHGKPVVYPEVGGLAEYMRDGETGLAYMPSDDAGMARAVERLIEDPGLRSDLGERARDFAERTFTREGYGGVAYSVLRELTECGAPAASWSAGVLAALVSLERRRAEALREEVETLRRQKEGLRRESTTEKSAEVDSAHAETMELKVENWVLREAERELSRRVAAAEDRIKRFGSELTTVRAERDELRERIREIVELPLWRAYLAGNGLARLFVAVADRLVPSGWRRPRRRHE